MDYPYGSVRKHPPTRRVAVRSQWPDPDSLMAWLIANPTKGAYWGPTREVVQEGWVDMVEVVEVVEA